VAFSVAVAVPISDADLRKGETRRANTKTNTRSGRAQRESACTIVLTRHCEVWSSPAISPPAQSDSHGRSGNRGLHAPEPAPEEERAYSDDQERPEKGTPGLIAVANTPVQEPIPSPCGCPQVARFTNGSSLFDIRRARARFVPRRTQHLFKLFIRLCRELMLMRELQPLETITRVVRRP
jgi:hypothetical protein